MCVEGGISRVEIAYALLQMYLQGKVLGSPLFGDISLKLVCVFTIYSRDITARLGLIEKIFPK